VLILALDSCGTACSVLLWQDGRILEQMREDMLRGQDARLIPMIVSAMEKAGLQFSDLDKIAVTRGPGSFTGVRVGLAAACGLGLAARKPVLGVDRFVLYRHLHKDRDHGLLVVIDSKRAEYFCKYFSVSENDHEPCLMTSDAIQTFISAHPDTKIVGDLATPDDEITLACAHLAASASSDDPQFLPRPLYLRAPDVTFPAAKSR